MNCYKVTWTDYRKDEYDGWKCAELIYAGNETEAETVAILEYGAVLPKVRRVLET